MRGGVWGSLRNNVRDVVFGLEDSLVSTLGTVTGVAVGTQDSFYVVLTGIVLVFVEAISMTAGSYLSSKSAKELYDKRAKRRHTPNMSGTPVVAAMFMCVFYLLGGFFTFAPYLFLRVDLAIPVTIGMTLVALFLVGVFKAKLTGSNIWRSGLEMFVVSTAAAGIGYGLGIVVPILFRATVTL